MGQVLFGSSPSGSSATATEYSAINGGGAVNWANTESNVGQVISTPGKIQKLSVMVASAPGAGKSLTFTLRVNGADSTLTCTISNTDTTGSDDSHQVAVVAGDVVTLSSTPLGTPTTGRTMYKMVFTPTTNNLFCLLGVGLASSTQLRYCSPTTSDRNVGSATEYFMDTVVPGAGTIKNLYVHLSAAPGAGSYTIDLRKNGVDTALTVTIVNPNTAGFAVADVAVVAGDRLTFRMYDTGATTSPYVHLGLTFEPTNVGQWVVMAVDSTIGSVTHFRQVSLCTPSAGWNSTESAVQAIIAPFTAKAFYVYIRSAPGVGNSRTFTVRKNGVNTALAVTLSDLTYKYGVVADVSFTEGDLISLKHTFTGAPVSDFSSWGLVGVGVSGWQGKISGVASPAKVMGVENMSIASVKGVI